MADHDRDHRTSGRDRRIVTLLVGIAAACGHAVSPPAPPPVVLRQCHITEVGPIDSAWHQVRASGFSFCVPGSWRPALPSTDSLDSRTWNGQEGSVTWDLGLPQSLGKHREASITGAVAIANGSNPSPVPELPGPAMRVTPGCPQPTNTEFTVDSVTVVVTQNECLGVWTTTAWTRKPESYLQAVTQEAKNTRLLNAIMATIRFSASPTTAR